MMRFYGLSDADVMAMPICRLFVYARQIPALRAEETMHAFEATSFPHLDKKARKQTMRRLQKELGEEARSGRAPIKKSATDRAKSDGLVGDIPADLVPFLALGKEDARFGGLVQIVRKPKAKTKDKQIEDTKPEPQ